MNSKLLILGAGDLGKIAKEIAEGMGTFETIAFLDDHSTKAIGKIKDSKSLAGEYQYAFPAISNTALRKKWFVAITEQGYQVPVLIHPSAHVSPSASIGPGSLVNAEAVINSNTTIENG